MSSLTLIAEIVEATVREWDLDLDAPIGPDTRLSADLCFSSIEMMHLLAAIDMRLGRKLPYERLIKAGDHFRRELTLGELSGFIDANAATAPETIMRPA